MGHRDGGTDDQEGRSPRRASRAKGGEDEGRAAALIPLKETQRPAIGFNLPGVV
jgi:hypothetical protein